MPKSTSAARPKDRLIHIRLSEETHQRLRIIAAARDTSIQILVNDLIVEEVKDGLLPSQWLNLKPKRPSK